MEASKLAGQWRSLAERFRRIASNDCRETDVKATAAVCGPVLPRMRDAGLIPANLILEPSAAELQEHAGQPDVIDHLWSTCWISFVSVISHPRINPGFPIPNALAIKSERRGGPEKLTVGSTDKADWRIRAENYAAICDMLAAVIDEDAEIGGCDVETQVRWGKWQLVHAALDQLADGGDGWNYKQKRNWLGKYNRDYKDTTGFLQLDLDTLSQIIRDRRKPRKKESE